MKRGRSFLSSLFFLLLQVSLLFPPGKKYCLGEQSWSRDDFPPDFVFGAGTSAYQVEGAVAEDGRSPSIWDTFTHQGRMADKSTGDITSDGYHKYKEDVKLMADLGLDSYRFSMSWSRLIPNGRGDVNPKGLQFYNNFIDELLKYGIKPHVTLYHLDHPQVLEDEYLGFLSPEIVDDFTSFADLCFKNFGDRVSRWTTFSEPNIMALGAYDNGLFAPGRCSYPFGINCMNGGNSTTEPYIAFHHILLAHASVVKLYRSKYQLVQNGWIGINVYTFWYYPYTNTATDIEAAQRALDFYIGWVLNPVLFGDYPKVMRKIVGSRLPYFTSNQSLQIKDSFDYIGINHYTSLYVKDNYHNASSISPRDYSQDALVYFLNSRNSTPDEPYDPSASQPMDPQGLQHVLEYIKHAYGNPPIFVEENGYGIGKKEGGLNDTGRIDYIRSYIGSTLDAMRNGVDVKGFFVWAFMDVFEVLSGFRGPCGLFHVDFEDENRPRTPKLSAYWYSKLIRNKDYIYGVPNKTAQSKSKNGSTGMHASY